MRQKCFSGGYSDVYFLVFLLNCTFGQPFLIISLMADPFSELDLMAESLKCGIESLNHLYGTS